MTAMSFEIKSEIERDEMLDVTVEFNIYPGDPGCTSGPADNWCPPSPDEVEITKVTYLGKRIDLDWDEYRRLEQECFEHVSSLEPDAPDNF